MVVLIVGFSKAESDFKKSKTTGMVMPSIERIPFVSKKEKNLKRYRREI